MGIRGLGGFIRSRLPQARKALAWSDHKGETWGIDCSCLLFRARASNLSPLTVMAHLLVRMRTAGIEAIIIFDGKAPAAKNEVLDQRRAVRVTAHKEMADIRESLVTATVTEAATMERRMAALQKKAPVVTSGDKDGLKKFLYAAGVRFITAAEEADDVLAFLCRDKTIQAVVSTDMDMLARGVPTLVVPETNDASVLTQILLGDVLAGLGLRYSQFVDACMLMGSDYSAPGWRSIDPRSAFEAARRGLDWSMVDASGSVCRTMEEGVARLMGASVTWDTIVSEKQRTKWSLGPPPKEPAALEEAVRANEWPVQWLSVLSS